MPGVLPAPLAVLAHGDAVRVVSLGLVRLVVPALALLAGEGDGDPDVSACHVRRSEVSGSRWGRAKETPAPGARSGRKDSAYPPRAQAAGRRNRRRTGRAGSARRTSSSHWRSPRATAMQSIHASAITTNHTPMPTPTATHTTRQVSAATRSEKGAPAIRTPSLRV